jgi:hydrogenase expression/formation protein HypE
MDKPDRILLAHGSGGKLTYELITELFVRYFGNPVLNKLDDSAIVDMGDITRLAVTTDAYVITPIFFSGGDIGRLSIFGTVNDISMAGATPLYITASFIIEEGLSIAELEKVVCSMKEAADICNVKIIAGDTKVVNKGACDKIFITTTGIGVIPEGIDISGCNVRVGDRIIVSGNIGSHGLAILSDRDNIKFAKGIVSDCAPLNTLVADMLDTCKHGIHSLRDITRGGLATILNEIAKQTNLGIVIHEENIPVADDVAGSCELLGMDVLYIACEGRLVAFVDSEYAYTVLEIMKKNKHAKDAAIIGEVVSDNTGMVILHTSAGGKRIVDIPYSEQLPRIC